MIYLQIIIAIILIIGLIRVIFGTYQALKGPPAHDSIYSNSQKV